MKLTLGFSPCPNDTFIFDAMIHHKIDTEGLDFEVFYDDVETLNQKAMRGELDITKLSYHAFAYVTDNYVLLDAGSWIYLKSGVVMGDRAPSIGERGFRATGDFSGILTRIAQKRYAKILVRGFHDIDFVYDYYMWPKPSGIRQALLDNYRETGRIPAVADYPYSKNWAEDPYYFGKISILEPKTDSQGK